MELKVIFFHLFHLANDVWNDRTMKYKAYNYASNLLYILESRDKIYIERLNLYFFLDDSN